MEEFTENEYKVVIENNSSDKYMLRTQVVVAASATEAVEQALAKANDNDSDEEWLLEDIVKI